MERTKPIALIGLMGSGKTAVARALAERLGRRAVALDEEIERAAGAPVAELFAREGEAAFRLRETAALRAALDRGAAIIDGGGGLVLDPENRALLRARCRVVWLEVAPGEAAHRMAAPGPRRPLIEGSEPAARLAAILAARTDAYAATAHVRVPTGGRDVAAVADAVLRVLEEAE